MNQGQHELADVPDGDLHYRVPAVAARLAPLRHALAAWAGELGLAQKDCDALVLASYEAMANSVEHAYHDHDAGILDVRAHREPDEGRVVVTVTDYGMWKAPQPSDGVRGRGLSLIQALTTTATITPTPNGTTVSMAWPLPVRS